MVRKKTERILISISVPQVRDFILPKHTVNETPAEIRNIVNEFLTTDAFIGLHGQKCIKNNQIAAGVSFNGPEQLSSLLYGGTAPLPLFCIYLQA